MEIYIESQYLMVSDKARAGLKGEWRVWCSYSLLEEIKFLAILITILCWSGRYMMSTLNL